MTVELEKEITVKLKWSLNEVKVHFVNIGRPLTGSFVLKDIYMVKNDIDIKKMDNLEILYNSVILREYIGNNHVYQLIYKNRKYNKGDIVDSQKYVCSLFNIDEAYSLLRAVGFKECFRYEQECLEYNSNDKNILIQYIPELGLFAQLEDNNKSVDELINDLNEMNIPYYYGDYFVKKASLMLETIKKKG